MNNYKKYEKNSPKKRNHAVTSVNLDRAHKLVLDKVGIRVSELVRDLIETHLKNCYPVELTRAKKTIDNEEN